MEEPDFQRVLFCLAKNNEYLIQLASSLRRKPGKETSKASFSLRNFHDYKFHCNMALGVDDPFGNVLTWDLVCKFNSVWNVELEIFLARKETYQDENIFSYPVKQVTSALELIQALDWAVAEIESSIESRDLSEWVKMSLL